jgi:WD40 repeat protein
VSPPVFADGTIIFGSGPDIRLCDVATGREQAVLSGHHGSVTHVTRHRDGRTLASSSNDHTVRLWNLPALRELGTLATTPDAAVTALIFTADGSRLIAGRKGKGTLVFSAAAP